MNVVASWESLPERPVYPERLAPLYDDPLTPRADFPLDVLPEYVRRCVEDVSHHVGFDAAGSASIALSVVSGLTQGKAHVQVFPMWREPLPIWVLIEAHSGAKKSAALRRFTRAIEAWELAENETRATYGKGLRHVFRAVKRTTPEYAVLEEAMPRRLVALTEAPTMEGLARLMCDQQGNAILATAEADQVNRVLAGAYSSNGGGGNVAALLKAYSGERIADHRAAADGTRACPRSSAAVILLGQENVVDRLLESSDFQSMGLFSRFLYYRHSNAESRQPCENAPVDDAAWAAWGDACQAITQAPWPDNAGPLNRDVQNRVLSAPPDGVAGLPAWPTDWRSYAQDDLAVIALTDEARAAATRLQRQLNALMAPKLRERDDASDFLNKLVGQAVRVAAALHALENPDSWWRRNVELSTLSRGIEVCRFSLAGLIALMSEDRGEIRAERNRSTLEGRVWNFFQRSAEANKDDAVLRFTWSQLRSGLTSAKTRIEQEHVLRGVMDDLAQEFTGISYDTSRRGEAWVVMRSLVEEHENA